MNQSQINIIKEKVEEMLQKMTVSSFVVTVNLSAIPQENKEVQDKKDDLLLDVPSVNEAPSMYLVTVNVIWASESFKDFTK